MGDAAKGGEESWQGSTRSLHFGGIDADADDLLDACFQDHEAYLRARNHERPLIIGRKGSGKTAIFRRIIQIREPNVFAFGHTFTDYPWFHHHHQAELGVPEERRFVHSWKYLILLTVAKILLNQDQSQPWNDTAAEELSNLERFIIDSYGSRDPDITQIFTPTKRLRIHPHLRVSGYAELGVDLERYPVSKLPSVFKM